MHRVALIFKSKVAILMGQVRQLAEELDASKYAVICELI
jgi:hypothetical protein